jgi:hypothetical protein
MHHQLKGSTMAQFLLAIQILRQIGPIVSEAMHLAQELFPITAGDAKLNFVLDMIDSNYPPDATQKAAFDTIKPAIVLVINGMVKAYKTFSPIFARP